MRYILLLSLLFWGCDDTGSQPVPFNKDDGGAGSGGAAAAGAGGAAEAGSGGTADGSMWIGVQDSTDKALAIGAFSGCEIDAITWTCPSGSGAAVAIEGIQRGGAEGHSTEPGLGEPDGPCDGNDNLETCTTPLGLKGWLAFKIEVSSLTGCELTIHEHPDDVLDSFNLFRCTGPDANEDCERSMLGQGVDGPNVFNF